jgi:Ca2+-dependent lipid-binding protein
MSFRSDLELKPHGKLTVTIVRADSLKNKELIGKSDPYVVLFVRPIFKEKTRVIDDNLNPEWNESFELIVEDKETQSLVLEVDTNSRTAVVLLLDHQMERKVEETGLIFFSPCAFRCSTRTS